MNTKFLSLTILSFGMVISGILLSNVLAQAAADVQYPVKELGNCQDEAACRIYCDKPQNLKVCLNFAEKNNLMSYEELQQARKFLASGGKGPGGCSGKDNCEEYCNNISHIDECISFAEKNNLIPPEELEEAKKVQAAIKRGVKPPPCGNKKQCDIYCSESDHMEECITFGIEAGFIQGKELEDVQKMLAALKKGIKPPPCKGKQACDAYCSDPEHMEVCMNFAMEAGFMSEEEKEGAQKMLQALKKGVKPPNCRGREECDVYCAEESHFEECMKFAEAAGFMSSEEAAMARKTGGKSPGGCKGKEQCEAFCNNLDNQETCFNFAKEHGLIPEEDLRRMEEGKQQFKQSMQEIPPEVYSCLESAVGAETMAKFKNGEAMPPRDIGDKMRVCFEQNIKPPRPGEPGEGGSMPPGPGGTEGAVPGNFAPRTTGPGGCTSPEECQNYCESNPEACKNFQPPAPPMQGGSPMPCQGENCPPPPSMPSGESGPAIMPPCESGNCPPPPQGSQQYQPPQPGSAPMPCEGSNCLPPPPPPPTSFLNSFLGLIIYPFKLLLR